MDAQGEPGRRPAPHHRILQAVLMKILVIDDSDLSRKIISDTLKKNGYAVCLAPSADKGLEEVPEFKPDLILLDVVMPGMSGWEACLKLKQAADKKHIPVVIMT